VTKSRAFLLGLALLFGIALAAVIMHPRETRRAIFMGTLFQGVDMTDEFADMRSLFPIRRVRTAAPTKLPAAASALSLPETYAWNGETRPARALLEETGTSGLLVLADGAIVHEEYALTGGPDVRWISWSVAKSFVSALVGIALGERRFESIEDPITKYLPELAGSAYDGVRIKDVLQMSSGASWNEDYGNYGSDITRFGMAIVLGGSQDEFARTLVREREPGSYNHYNSTDTQVLGMLLVRVTGRPIADYMEEKLWQPLAMERDAYWITDDAGMELAFGGLNATLRDYARFGELYRNGGRWNGRQVVPADWVAASVRADAPHLQPGENPQSDWVVGYGYQWWLPESDEGEFSAIGVYNQFIYVNPVRGVVIAKTSANPAYGTDESTDRELETLAMFSQIARSVRPEASAPGVLGR
jgi:CubicO group peptidase (beta-lactamase class C family)